MCDVRSLADGLQLTMDHVRVAGMSCVPPSSPRPPLVRAYMTIKRDGPWCYGGSPYIQLFPGHFQSL